MKFMLSKWTAEWKGTQKSARIGHPKIQLIISVQLPIIQNIYSRVHNSPPFGMFMK